MFVKGHQKFKAWVAGIIKTYNNSQLYQISKKYQGLQPAFFSLTGLGGFEFMSTSRMPIPKNAQKLVEYPLGFGIMAEVYDVPGKEARLYVQKNPRIIVAYNTFISAVILGNAKPRQPSSSQNV